MYKFQFIFLISFLIILSGCSSVEPEIPDEQPDNNENLYLDFNKWVYQEMNAQYLWREDLPDSLDCNYDLAPKAFFESLLSSKDRFSYFTSNPYYNGSRSEYPGFAYQKVRDKNGNEFLQVIYVTSYEAKKSGLKRGDLLEMKKRVGNKILYRRYKEKEGKISWNGEILEITIDDVLGPENTVLLDTVYKIDAHKIGYLCYLNFGEPKDLEPCLNKFLNEDITDLILDLRYNPGGLVSTSKFLSNCIVSSKGYGHIFQKYRYNDILTLQYTLASNDSKFYSSFSFPQGGGMESIARPIIGLNMKKVYVITSSRTASASEATIICLKPYMEVVTIGEKTVGKGVGSWNIYDSKYPYSIQPITMRYFNADEETVPDEGLMPDYPVAGSSVTAKIEIGETNEPLLDMALSLILNGVSRHVSPTDNYNPEILTLVPIGNPSYIDDFNNKYYNESN